MGVKIVVNGGTPLKGCPKDWDEAKVIVEKLNEGKNGSDLQWSFDCGFKLDYDGEILSVSSRFYPPKSHYGETWDGTVTIYFLGKEIKEKDFNCKTLDELKDKVDKYVKNITDRINLIFQ
jgi:hypothetical protein